MKEKNNRNSLNIFAIILMIAMILIVSILIYVAIDNKNNKEKFIELEYNSNSERIDTFDIRDILNSKDESTK